MDDRTAYIVDRGHVDWCLQDLRWNAADLNNCLDSLPHEVLGLICASPTVSADLTNAMDGRRYPPFTPDHNQLLGDPFALCIPTHQIFAVSWQVVFFDTLT